MYMQVKQSQPIECLDYRVCGRKKSQELQLSVTSLCVYGDKIMGLLLITHSTLPLLYG